ncbi:MAG: alpha/beta hydrolase [Candidatus Nanopelagicales bacterium]
MTVDTQYTTNGDVTIAYEEFGDPAGAPLLMIMGLDFQMVWWPDGLCEQLVAAGFHVVRFDNRDTGLSTHFASARKQNALRAQLGMSTPVYTAIDMLADAAAVMDAVGWQEAHILGASMGAGLAQAFALTYPQRTLSLTSMMGLPATVSSFGSLKYIRMGTLSKMFKIKPAADRASEVEMLTDIYRLIASPGYPFPEEWAREVAGISYDRAPRDPDSTQRQLAATRAQKYPSLSTITVPTLVIGGEDDPIIKISGSRDTAKQIPGARLVTYPGVGHNLPEAVWPAVVSEIATTAGLSAVD